MGKGRRRSVEDEEGAKEHVVTELKDSNKVSVHPDLGSRY